MWRQFVSLHHSLTTRWKCSVVRSVKRIAICGVPIEGDLRNVAITRNVRCGPTLLVRVHHAAPLWRLYEQTIVPQPIKPRTQLSKFYLCCKFYLRCPTLSDRSGRSRAGCNCLIKGGKQFPNLSTIFEWAAFNLNPGMCLQLPFVQPHTNA
jgi:hypothetical protein